MTRHKLSKLEDLCSRFSGIFERYGTRTNWNGYPERTILLKNIKHIGGTTSSTTTDTIITIVSDHIWFKDTIRNGNVYL